MGASEDASTGAQRPIVVMKFGGTSVGTPEGRDAIAARVTEALEAVLAPVVVVSAMGRKGAPYATDTLLGLVEGLPADERERDLLAATGEVIAAVVVAHELRDAGIEAAAYTGAEAGIGTDGVHGDGTITEIHPAPLLDAIASGAFRLSPASRASPRMAHSRPWAEGARTLPRVRSGSPSRRPKSTSTPTSTA